MATNGTFFILSNLWFLCFWASLTTQPRRSLLSTASLLRLERVSGSCLIWFSCNPPRRHLKVLWMLLFPYVTRLVCYTCDGMVNRPFTGFCTAVGRGWRENRWRARISYCGVLVMVTNPGIMYTLTEVILLILVFWGARKAVAKTVNKPLFFDGMLRQDLIPRTNSTIVSLRSTITPGYS